MTSAYPGNANWPSDFQGCTIQVGAIDLSGKPLAGQTVTLQCSAPVLLDVANNKIIPAVQLVLTTDVNGLATVVVPATDDPDISPNGFTYTVTEGWAGGRSYSIAAPQGTTVQLATVAPVTASNGVAIVRGPAGPAVPLTSATQQSLLTAQSTLLTPMSAAIANRHYARCDVVVLGDSLTEGQGQTAFNNRWVQRLQDVLRAKFPTTGLTGGGRGFIPARLTATMLAGSPTYSSPFTATLANTTEQGGYGPAQSSMKITASGDKVTIPVNCTSVDIMFVKSVNGNTLYYSWDAGATKTTFSTAASPIQDGGLLSVVLGHLAVPPSPGANTLEIGWSSGTATAYLEGIIEYNGDETKGIQVHGAGHYGWTSATWIASAGISSNWPAAVAALSPDVIVIELGTNDQGANMVPSTFQANLTSMLAMIRNAPANVGIPVIFLMATKIQATATYPMSAYVSAAQAVATTDIAAGNTTAVFDLSLRFPLAQGSAFVSGTDPAGLFSATDHLHLTNKGASMWADVIANGLMLGT